MSGNASFEYSRAALLAVTEVEAPLEVTSDDLDEKLKDVLARLKLPASLPVSYTHLTLPTTPYV